MPLALAETGESASILLKYGASLKIGGLEKRTAVRIAIIYGKVEVLSTPLTMSESVASVRSQGYKLLRLAIQSSNLVNLAADVENLIHHVQTFTLLHYSCTGGFVEISRVFLEHGAEINQTDDKGYTPLNYACVARSDALARFLLEHGANVFHRASDGETPLLIATKVSRSLASLLVDHGAPVNVVDTNGRTPLHIVAQKGQSELVSALLSRGAAPDTPDKNGHTPLRTVRERRRRIGSDTA